jgi:hypothetical protein
VRDCEIERKRDREKGEVIELGVRDR